MRANKEIDRAIAELAVLEENRITSKGHGSISGTRDMKIFMCFLLICKY